jgi:hypothetical protein
MDLNEYLTITEAAKVMNKTVSMVGRLCRAGKFDGAEKKGNAAWLIPRAAVESYAPGRRGPATRKERAASGTAGIREEIAALEARYGTEPNAETAAAIEECMAGKGKKFSSIAGLMADLHDGNGD